MTHLDLLNQLPSPIREQAIENCNAEYLDSSEHKNLHQVLFGGFAWADSPQKEEYWVNIYTRSLTGEYNDLSVTLPLEGWEKLFGLLTVVEDLPQFSADAKHLYKAIQSQLNSQQ